MNLSAASWWAAGAPAPAAPEAITHPALFTQLMTGSLVLVALLLVGAAVALVRTKVAGNRLVLADTCFLLMVILFLVWSFINPNQIAFEVALLCALLGPLSTLSLARILSNGRR